MSEDPVKTQNVDHKYQLAFPPSYMEKNASDIFDDIKNIEKLNVNCPLVVKFNVDPMREKAFILKLYQYENVTALSDILPILENMDLRTLREDAFEVRGQNNKLIILSQFSLTYKSNYHFNFLEVQQLVEEAIAQSLQGHEECDGLNRLILSAGLSLKKIHLVRAYVKYLKQIKFKFSSQFIENTLCAYPEIIRMFVNLFDLMQNPEQVQNGDVINVIQDQISQDLDHVKDIREDTVIRRVLQLIQNTLRTNYYQTSATGTDKKYIALKLDSQAISDMPLPKPLVEIFVYSAEFEGVHLRSHKISRGGIRWSDRHDDFRTEILGLMKAQKVKNSVIVPSGAKGGFVLKKMLPTLSRDEVQKNVIHCYRQFISGLLDVTDNIQEGKVVHPADVVCRDGDDPYLVVAADKGTATFSDIANEISEQYHFWLGDAFASGGRYGYDHKKMGITARGAWESAKRHLLELGLQDQEIIVAGIGDMSGDVFGNGMIYSNKIKLVAAFDHRHIFLDPNPNCQTSYEERVRMFNLDKSDWSLYRSDLISSGGGVFSRTCKTIAISPEMKKRLEISDDELTPDELIRAILRAPVDMIFNGGIGTYVKSSRETSEQVGDKSNEYCRVDGNELRCKIVCEGGNLGFTQLGRVEYALKGGLINTDFIDNSAGVDCSDHEVNIKIFLNQLIASGKLDVGQRNAILAEMESSVGDLVLYDNFCQALVMSYTAAHAFDYHDLYSDHMVKLAQLSGLDRRVEYLPTDQELQDRKSRGKGLTRPELAVLLAYTKIYLKEEILKSNLPENDYFNSVIFSAFPNSLREKFKTEIYNHFLRREIIATQLSNQIINMMGITFLLRLKNETGASIGDIATAQSLAAYIFNAEHLKKIIESMNGAISLKMKYDLLHLVRQLLNMATRWFLKNGRLNGNMQEVANYYKQKVEILAEAIPDLIVGSTRQYLTDITEKFTNAGISSEIARKIAISRVMYTALNIIEVAHTHQFDLLKTAEIYFQIGGRFNLVWIRDLLAKDNSPGMRNNLFRLTLRDDLDILQRKISIVLLESNPIENDVSCLINCWIQQNQEKYTRWLDLLKTVQETEVKTDFAMIFVILRELSDMIEGAASVERFKYLMQHDDLTGLPNRMMLMHQLQKILEESKSENKQFAVHFIDIDRFKDINDNFGHDVGDKVLQAIAVRLRDFMQSKDSIGRLSGDEFIVIQPHVKDFDDVKQFSRKMYNALREPVEVSGHTIHLSASVGAATYPFQGELVDDLVRAADKAMYAVKLRAQKRSRLQALKRGRASVS